ncbi:hypothetical protein [Streptomyces sp. Ncost-T10-10d]|uniref:hypothetical protein n=1 Tax=Streptomyces sp. Ncost-T10-10d TaxID=1839774 RepID=UPI00081F3CC5|nr:hypothetical protein [Streptomyces sp. Ncost-T10-10d]SCF72992.1 hypothetical protein GA0115254_114110 [Streptomyces sp. Ncost-T10-10d]
MGKFFDALATKLAERWATYLVLPGLLFTASAVFGSQVGHQHALDRDMLMEMVSNLTAAIARQGVGTQVILACAVLLVATGVGLVAQALAGGTRAIWLGQWPWPLRLRLRQSSRRRERWHRLVQHRRALEQARPRASRTQEEQRAINQAAQRINRLSLAEPDRPTWMGDRINAVERVALDRYGLDLPFTWPRLWLVLPEITRTEITTAHAAFVAATATGTWAWPYAVLAVFWWPAALIGAAIMLTGWARARSAISDLSTLSEAAVDVHARTLAIELAVAGPESAGPLTLDEGERITSVCRKGR